MTKFQERFLILLVLLSGVLLVTAPVAAATSQIHIVKYASDGTTILSETTKTYQWLEANLPVLGDGVTHYYHQGPVFVDNPDPVLEQELRWNPDEDTNVQEKDNGAVKGTNLKDICDLVGGMNAGETVKLKASDGFFKTFAYTNVYEYPARQGPMVITWNQNGIYPDGGYTDGMKLVFFADDSTNPWGIHAMGNFDWHESAAPEYWYYYISGSEQYPTTTGLSVKYISDVLIYSDDPPPLPLPSADFTANVTAGLAPLSVRFTDTSTGGPTTWQWNFGDGTANSTVQNPVHTFQKAGSYTVSLTVTNAQGSDSETKSGFIKAAYRLNAGAPPSTYTDTSGLLWLKDKKYTTGGYGYVTAGKAGKTTTAIANTSDDYLYQYWRYNSNADLKYNFTVTNGNYQVTLKFVEPDYNDNRRVFDILIEGYTKASSYRIYDQAGGRYKAKDAVYTATVSDGILNLHLKKLSGANNPSGRNTPLICAVEVRPV